MEYNLITSLRQSIANLIAPKGTLLINPFNETFFSTVGGGYSEYDPENVTYLEKGYNINPIVYSVINQQASKTASIPFYVRKIKDEPSLNKMLKLKEITKENYSPQQLLTISNLQSKAFENEELPFPMDRPNVSQTWQEFIALYKTFLALVEWPGQSE